MNARRTAAGVALAAGALSLAGLWWATQPATPQDEATAASPQSHGALGASVRVRESGPLAAPTSAIAHATTRDSFLTPDLRQRFEALWLEAGDAPDAGALKQRLLGLVPRHFAPAEAVRASQLLARYVDYRSALGAVKPPHDLSDPHALRQAMEARGAVRRQHFSEDEREALFAAEEAQDRYLLARIEIARNQALTAQQKEAALRAAEAELSGGERQWRADATQHLDVAAHTASLDAKGAGEHDRYRERRALYGDEAAQRLAQLDREEREWQARLAEYAAASARSSDARDLEALRQRLFSTEEQARLPGALALRQQGSARQ